MNILLWKMLCIADDCYIPMHGCPFLGFACLGNNDVCRKNMMSNCQQQSTIHDSHERTMTTITMNRQQFCSETGSAADNVKCGNGNGNGLAKPPVALNGEGGDGKDNGRYDGNDEPQQQPWQQPPWQPLQGPWQLPFKDCSNNDRYNSNSKITMAATMTMMMMTVLRLPQQQIATLTARQQRSLQSQQRWQLWWPRRRLLFSTKWRQDATTAPNMAATIVTTAVATTATMTVPLQAQQQNGCYNGHNVMAPLRWPLRPVANDGCYNTNIDGCLLPWHYGCCCYDCHNDNLFLPL